MYSVIQPTSHRSTHRKSLLQLHKDTKLVVADFCYHLATMEKAGLPLLNALILAKDMQSSLSFKKIITSVFNAVQNGASLSKALEGYPFYFNHVFIQLMRLGERDGQYHPYLFEMEHLLRWQDEARTQIRRAIRYPFFLFVMFVALTASVTQFLFPEIEGYFKQMGMNELPSSTATFLKFSQFIGENSIYAAMGIAGLVGIFILLRILIPVVISRINYKIPLIGALRWRYDIGWFLNNLGVMLRAKMDLIVCLEDALQSVKNPYLNRLIERLPETLKNGETLSQAIRKIPKMGEMTVQLLELGETTGNLAEPILNAARFNLDTVKRRLYTLTTIIEPFLILTMGGLLLWIVLAVFWPLYDHMGTVTAF